jgi:protease II
MKKHQGIVLLLGLSLLLLQACGQPAPAVNKTETKPEPVAEVITEKRDYVTEHNYITYDDESHPLVMPQYNVYKAKEWPPEDLDNAESYDQPRLQFFWDNGNSRKMKSDAYEKRQKIWSMKMDGTDLRLVTDDFDGRTRGRLRRSPNNRYLAYAYANDGLHKVLFDLKTQESIILGSSSTLPILVWAEDSSYLYYSNGREYIKYTLATKKKEAVDIDLTPETVIYDGKRVVVYDFGVGVYRESDNKELYSIVTEEEGVIPPEQGLYREKSISANGKYAWAKNRYHKVFIDIENKTWFAVDNKGVDKWKIHTMDNISVNGDEYQMGAAWVTLYAMDKGGNKLSYKRWTPIGTGRGARLSNVYNAFANNGRFFTKEGK